MAAEIKTESGEKVNRADVLQVNPHDTVVGRNCRLEPAQVTERAVSMCKHGQRTPCDAHRDPETKKVVIDDGASRRAAAILIREGFQAVDPDDGQTRTFHDPNFQLRVTVDTRKVSTEEQFVRSYIGNMQRAALNDVEEADAQQVLREEYRWTDSRIAVESGYTNQNRVMALKKIVTAPEYVRELIKDGKLALYVYSENLFGLGADVIRGAIDFATDDKGSVSGTKVREYVRNVLSGKPVENEKTEETAEETGESKAKPKGPRVPKRTIKDFKKFAENYCHKDNSERNERAVEFLAVLQRWFDCDLKTDRQLLAALAEIK